jgi:hypothetical protein
MVEIGVVEVVTVLVCLHSWNFGRSDREVAQAEAVCSLPNLRRSQPKRLFGDKFIRDAPRAAISPSVFSLVPLHSERDPTVILHTYVGRG